MAAPPPVPSRTNEPAPTALSTPEENHLSGMVGDGAKKMKSGAQSVLHKAVSSTKWYTSKDHNEKVSPENSNQQETKSFGLRPQKAFCKRCGQENMTTISHVIGRGTIIAGIVTFFIFPGITACLLKTKVCKDVEHKCSVCGRKLGRRKKLPC